MLWGELLRRDTEREVAFRGEARYVQRICAVRETTAAADPPPRYPLPSDGLLQPR